MSKFKVGDKVRVRKDLMIGKIYGGWGFTEKMEKYKNEIFTIKAVYKCENELKEIGHCWTDEMLEEVKEDKMEKTFREVIADIKEGEVWESSVYRITRNEKGISIIRKDGFVPDGQMFFRDTNVYKLQRKEYTFEEAFKAYEEGKGIESLIEGQKFKKEGKEDCWFDYDKDKYMSLEWDRDCFTITSVRNKWYIND